MADAARLFERMVRDQRRATVFALWLGVFLYTFFGILDWQIYPEHAPRLLPIRVAWVSFALVILGITVVRPEWYYRWSQWMLGTATLSAGIGVIAMLAIVAGHPRGDVYYAGLMMVVVYVFIMVPIRMRLAVALSLALVAVYNLSIYLADARPPAPVIVSNNFFLVGTSVMCGIAALSLQRSFFDGYRHGDLIAAQKGEIEAQRKRADDLLANLLPGPVADKLLEGASQIADGYADVTVLFADICGFTEYSATVSPRALVRLLNRIFSGFDDVADRMGVEKIKTIGDAYMAVCGLPTEVDDHPERMVRMALGMCEEMGRIRQEQPDLAIDIRIGIHTGPCVAGVIGRKRFIYDLWGDTVNLASRMESTGVKGRIQVSEATYHRVKHAFGFEARRELDIKGRGRMAAYVVEASAEAVPREPVAA
jgi:class 3 adenylate cyclase